MFTFTNYEINSVVRNNDLYHFLNDLRNAKELTEEDVKFIGYYLLQNPYSRKLNPFQRRKYLIQLNNALIWRNNLPTYTFSEYQLSARA